MNFLSAFLQFPNDPVALAEWFLASIVLVVVVTLIYVFVLSRSPPPEGITVAKIESSAEVVQTTFDPGPELSLADAALKNNDTNSAIEHSIAAVNLCLKKLYQDNFGIVPANMSASDLAYILQSRAKSAPQFAEPVYQLNNLRLRAEQRQMIDTQQASWAVSFANWLIQAMQTSQIKF